MRVPAALIFLRLGGLRARRPRVAAAVALAGAVLAGAVAAGVLGGCGGLGSGSAAPVNHDVALELDFTPNAVHAGIYTAIARGFDQAEGVAIHVHAPGASTDSVRLLTSGRADFAILDIHDLALARERGANIVGIMAIVERPLAAVISAPAVMTPRALAAGGGAAGRPVGVTGLPSDLAVLRSVVAGAGGDPSRVRTVTIGFDAVSALLSGRVSAATAFWSDEGVTLARTRPGFHVFRVDRYGAPPYPELVLCATAAKLREDPGGARAVVRALVRGYGVTITDPESSASDLESRVPGLDPGLVAAELSALGPALMPPDPVPGGGVGALDRIALRAWSKWEARFGIVKRPIDISRAFDPQFVAGTASLNSAGG